MVPGALEGTQEIFSTFPRLWLSVERLSTALDRMWAGIQCVSRVEAGRGVTIREYLWSPALRSLGR